MELPESDDGVFTLESGEDSAVPLRRGFNKTAWILIVAAVGFVTHMQNGGRQPDHPLQDAQSSPQNVIMLLQCRYLVAAADFSEGNAKQFYQQALVLNQGTIEQRLRFAVVAQEMVDVQEALTILHDLDTRLLVSDVRQTDEQRELRAAIGNVMADYAQENWNAPSVNERQKALIRDELGWFGRLALAPKQSGDTAARRGVMSAAQRTLFSIIGAGLLVCCLLLVGSAGLVLFVVFVVSGDVKGGFQCSNSPNAGIYAETFVVWMCLFVFLTRAAAAIPAEGMRMLVLAAAMFVSLSALVWPRLRRIGWSDIRRDIGWTAGRNPIWEAIIGGGCYLLTIPIVFIGILLSAALMHISETFAGPVAPGNEFAPTSLPNHPIIGILSQADWTVILQLYLVAAVAAPVVEETMFRGVMYRNLRESSRRWGFLLSFLFSATVNSLIFALIHPQGYVAVPALMAIALGLTLAREWRGTLIPAMVTHGIHNGFLLTVLILAVGE